MFFSCGIYNYYIISLTQTFFWPKIHVFIIVPLVIKMVQ